MLAVCLFGAPTLGEGVYGVSVYELGVKDILFSLTGLSIRELIWPN